MQRQTGLPTKSYSIVHPGHHQGEHGLDTGVPVQVASDVADGAQVMEHGALDALDLAMHVHGGVHDDAEVAEGGHCMHSDPTNAHSRLQRSGRWSGSAEL